MKTFFTMTGHSCNVISINKKVTDDRQVLLHDRKVDMSSLLDSRNYKYGNDKMLK